MSIMKKIAYLEQLAKISAKEAGLDYSVYSQRTTNRASKGWRRAKSFWTIMKELKPNETFYYSETNNKYYIDDGIKKRAVWYTPSNHDFVDKKIRRKFCC